jgi:hypothetical protein
MSVRRTNRFWSVSLEHTLFLDFLKLFVNIHLAVSFAGKKNRIFWTYGSKVMGVWSFKEKSGHGGHVLEPTSKSWPLAQKVEGRKKKNSRKMGTAPQVQASIRGRRVTVGRRLALGRRLATFGRWTAGVQRSGPGRPAATGPRPLVAGSPATRGRRPQVGGLRLIGDQQSPTGRGSTPALVGQFTFFWNFFI